MSKKSYLYFSVGSALIPVEEFKQLIKRKDFQEFLEKAKEDTSIKIDPFQIDDSGTLTPERYKSQFAATKFTQTGLGKPLVIKIHDIYTGTIRESIKGPFKFVFGASDYSLLLTSSVKSYFTFDSQPRAINAVIPKIEDRQYFTLGTPTIPGTPVIPN